MNLAAPFIARPKATTLLAFGVACAGVVAFLILPVASLPKVDFPTIMVQASLPGANPTTMASSVAAPLERQLGTISGITEMTSSSSMGSTRIVLQFDLARDIDGAAVDVQAAINASLSNLPSYLPGLPTYKKVNPADAPIMIMTLTSDEIGVPEMYDLASSVLQQRISQIDGVGQVNVGGGSLPAIRVEVNPTALNNNGVSLADVATVINDTNSNSAKGQIIIGDQQSNIVSNDQLLHAREYGDLIINYNNGAALRVKDIATVSRSVEDLHNAGISNNKASVVLIVYRAPTANVIETVDRVRAALPMLQASIKKEIALNIIMDRTTTLRTALVEVEKSLILSAILVVLVVYLTLGNVRSALIPSVAVPLSILGTFALMYLFNFSLNNLSLMALTIVTGFVIDDAVVVLENISRKVETGMQPLEAAIQGAKEVGFTVVSMSISLIAVFIPIIFMQGVVGRLFREFALTLSFAILVSLVVSLTVTPMLSAKLFATNGGLKTNKFITRYMQRCNDFYSDTLDWALENTALVQIIMILTLGLTVLLFMLIPKGFFPQQDTGRVVCSIQAQQDMSFKEIKQKLTEFVRISSEDPAVATAAGYVSTSSGSGNAGNMFLTLKPSKERKLSIDDVIARLRNKMSNVTGAVLYMQAAQDLQVGGRPGNAQFQYTLSADNVGILNKWAPKVVAELSKLPGVVDVNSDQRDKGLQTYIDIDRDTASRLGVSIQQIDTALYSAFGQRQVATLYEAMNQYHIVMTVSEQFWEDPAVLDQIYVPNNLGTLVPLSAFAKFTNDTMLLAINHQGQFPAATLSFNLLPGAALGDAVAKAQAAIDNMHLPAEIQGSFQGNAKAFQQSLESESYLIITAILSVYIVLGILYESVIHPITILSTLPSAGLGALLALILTGTQLTIIAIIGMILLIGIVKKNAIMMIDFALHLQRTENRTPKNAIYHAAKLRFRPIMMTTLAAFFGALPLVIGRGDGYQLREPLGIAIMGGLLISQILTLYTTPVLYLTLDKTGQWWRNKWQRFMHHPMTPEVTGGNNG